MKKLEMMKNSAVQFYKMAFEGNPRQVVDLYEAMDFFRFDEEQKIIEHWDSIQEVIKEMKSNRSMFI